MPKIGMRIIKTALAVFICFLIYIIRGEGLPFYSSIAAIMCMQPGVSNTITVSGNRFIGTFLGGIFGMMLLVFERKYMVNTHDIFRFSIISIAIIPVIYTSVLLAHKQASHTSCIVFLSIVVNHAADVNPYYFAVSRVIDTLIGIIVAVVINGFHFPKKKNTDIIFISELEGTLMNSNEQFTTYAKVKISEMISDGARITLATNKTSAEIIKVIEDLNIKLPIITMDGAAVYDWETKSYTYIEAIDYATSIKIIDIIKSKDINFFANTIVNDVIHIFYGEFKNSVEKDFYNKEKLLPMKNYILSNLPHNREVTSFTIIEKINKAKELQKELCKSEFSNSIRFLFEEYDENYVRMKIYSSKASKGNAVLEVKRALQCNRIVTFGNSNEDISMLKVSDMSYAVSNGTEDVKVAALNIINDNDSDAVVKTINKLFYLKRIN